MSDKNKSNPKTETEYSDDELVRICAIDNGWASDELAKRLCQVRRDLDRLLVIFHAERTGRISGQQLTAIEMDSLRAEAEKIGERHTHAVIVSSTAQGHGADGVTCEAIGPENMRCNRLLGHAGDHHAEQGDWPKW